MNNLKKIAKMIEKELGHTNGWKIPDEEYSAKCHILASKIVSQMQPQVKPEITEKLKELLRQVYDSHSC